MSKGLRRLVWIIAVREKYPNVFLPVGRVVEGELARAMAAKKKRKEGNRGQL